jgi:dipeptidyl aminopeptidase/acylaminoacyl peptidase
MPDPAVHLLPGFVFVHGSGCIDRDETVGPNRVFAQLANRLSNDGYAVLRYDKRSCGKSGGTFATRDRLIADARDAIACLRAQPGIDPARIFVLGHSEGGELAPSIAIADGKLRGIVLLAPPALPLERIIMQQVLRTATSAQRASIRQQEQAQLDAIAAGKKAGASAAWLRSSFGIDPAALITNVPCSILIVQGTKDIQVLAADTPRLVDAARAAHRRLTVVMLQNDDHLFIKVPVAEASAGVEYFTPSYLDPALFSAIEIWLAKLT